MTFNKPQVTTKMFQYIVRFEKQCFIELQCNRPPCQQDQKKYHALFGLEVTPEMKEITKTQLMQLSQTPTR